MADAIMKNEIIDEKIYLANKLLSEGKTKFQAAKATGYQGVDGLDRYAKKLGYTWNSSIKCYELNDMSDINHNVPERVRRILSMIEKGLALDDIAKYHKMKNSQELALYMKAKGYVWDIDKGNYIKKNMMIPSEIEESEDNTSMDTLQIEEKEIDILKLLESNKGKLIELLAYKSNETVPRYLIKGISVTKGFFISSEIDRLIKDFSKEKSVLQKDIIQTALIEFFQKYGFKEEVSAVLKG